MKPNVEVRVSDLIQPGLTIRGPYGAGEPMALRAPWDGAELALISTATLADIDVVLDRARAAAEAYRWFPAWKRAALGLDARVLERLAAFGRDEARDLLRVVLDQVRGALQDRGALPGREPAVRLGGRASAVEDHVDVRERGRGDQRQLGAVPRRAQRHGLPVTERPADDQAGLDEVAYADPGDSLRSRAHGSYLPDRLRRR